MLMLINIVFLALNKGYEILCVLFCVRSHIISIKDLFQTLWKKRHVIKCYFLIFSDGAAFITEPSAFIIAKQYP